MLWIVTDSTADIATLPSVAQLPISVVPLSLEYGGVVYDDDAAFDRARFYAELTAASADHPPPRTSQPSPQKFCEAYQAAIDRGATHILSFHVSGGLSGTVQAATMGKQLLGADEKKVTIEVIDSRTITYGLGMGVLAAAEAALVEEEPAECRARAERIFAHHQLFFTVGDLTYLVRGGRIGKAAAFVGSALRIAPIISMAEGQVVGVERVRGRKRLIDKMLGHFLSAYPAGSQVTGALLTSVQPETEEDSAALHKQLTSTYRCQGLLSVIPSPAIICHVGPSAWGAILTTAGV